ncbi:trypco2 family protein [Streptomyces sp. NPDC002580]|uniref:trypco2 family protein n=1 Tax=Streptomyces sp. NPDC002580 TaxID=3364653 RepID=UPI0036BBC220
MDISEALEDLRQQLYRAQDMGRNQQFRFKVEKAELHLEVQIRQNGSGRAKVSIGPAGAEAGGEVGRARTHRLVLTLNVLDQATGDQAQINDEEPGTAGGQEPEGQQNGSGQSHSQEHADGDEAASLGPQADVRPTFPWDA